MRYTFTMQDQNAFASFCGDSNPMHVDMVRARRTQAGGAVVHGVHILLWTLETLLHDGAATPKSLKARFRAPLLAGSQADIVARQKAGGVLAAKVMVGETTCSTIELLGSVIAVSGFVHPRGGFSPAPMPREPLDVAFQDALSTCGRYGLFVPETGASEFPAAEMALGQRRVRAIGFISALVGMICPGLHSLLGAVDILLEGPQTDWVDFKVVEADERFRRIVIDAAGGGVTARIEAFFRPAPVAQPSMPDLDTVVGSDEFQGVSALVVGGSRGLGALTAKILAVGGADVLITYAVGREDAQAVQQEIQAAGGRCRIMMFDVLKDNMVLPPACPALKHVYYFATPKIVTSRAYNRDVFGYFLAFYVDGLERLVRAIAPHGAIAIFNPSTVAIHERMTNLAEYAMAKAASETLALYLEKAYAGLTIVSPRLPRMPTDQTSSISPVQMESAIDVMLTAIRSFHARTEAG